MKVYLVGGAVRDELMGRVPKDRDYVVVGATPEQMLAKGYKQVGADFPVFLDPDTNEEYALARTERKTGVGYNGFETSFDVGVTLEDDLRRRDLTINAMARDLETGELVDPFDGAGDLELGTLRHVSPAFAEDPLRVLRVARFRARYGFKLAPATMVLMSELTASGELNHLTTERVWAELQKGLSEDWPALFVTTLMCVGAWDVLFPGVVAGESLHRMDGYEFDFVQRLMVLFSETPNEVIEATLTKYKAPWEVVSPLRVFRQLAVAAYNELTPTTKVSILKSVDAYQRPNLLLSCVDPAFAVRPEGFDQFVEEVVGWYNKTKAVGFASLSAEQKATLKGAEIGSAIDAERAKLLA